MSRIPHTLVLLILPISQLLQHYSYILSLRISKPKALPPHNIIININHRLSRRNFKKFVNGNLHNSPQKTCLNVLLIIDIDSEE